MRCDFCDARGKPGTLYCEISISEFSRLGHRIVTMCSDCAAQVDAVVSEIKSREAAKLRSLSDVLGIPVEFAA